MQRRLLVPLLALATCLVGAFLLSQVGRDRNAQFDGLSFTYPGDWTLTVVDRPLHYETVLAFLTSPGASARESCGPDYIPGLGGGCTDTYSVPPGSAVLRLSEWAGPPAIKGPIVDLLDAGWQPVTIAGRPAAYSGDEVGSTTGTDRVEWRIAAPGANSLATFGIVATMSEPSAGLRGQITALLTTLRIAPTGP